MFSGRDVKQARGLWIVLASGIILGLFLLRVVSLDIVRPMVLFDEVEHIDYAVHLSEGVVPTWGTVLNDRTVALASCIGNQDVSTDCVRVTPKVEATAKGFSYEAGQSPVGYLPMAIAARYVVDGSAYHYQQILFLRLANLTSFAFLAVALAFAFSFLTRSFVTVAAISGLLIANPWFFGAFTYVTNDSAAITAGAIGVGAYLAWLKRLCNPMKRPTLWIAAASFFMLGILAGSVKVTGFFPIVAVALGIVIHSLIDGQVTGLWRKLIPLSCGTLGLLMAHVALGIYRSGTALVSEKLVLSDLLMPSYRPLQDIALARLKDFQALVLGQSIFEGTAAPTHITPALVALGLISCLLILWTLASPESQFRSWVPTSPQILILSTLLTSLIVLVAFPVYTYVQGPFEPPFAGRFLGPLLPLYALAVIPLVERRGWLRLSLVVVTIPVLTFLSVPASEVFRNFPS